MNFNIRIAIHIIYWYIKPSIWSFHPKTRLISVFKSPIRLPKKYPLGFPQVLDGFSQSVQDTGPPEPNLENIKEDPNPLKVPIRYGDIRHFLC